MLCGTVKEGPEGTEGERSMPTISLLEMVPVDMECSRAAVTTGSELRVDIALESVISLEDVASISDGISR